MGGKSYYCDYCFCYLKNDINVRKTHNSGLIHKIAKLRYMRPYEDPKKLLEEESKKEPCGRFLNGKYCKFDLVCNSTHFDQRLMQRLRQLAEIREKFQARKTASKLNLSQSENPIALPWQATTNRRTNRKRSCRQVKRLPESLKPINFNRMNGDFLNLEWG